MEFLRFGSSIPGSYWGCCACDIIQNFKVDPDAKASIQLVNGDGGQPIQGDGGMLFAGPTYKDIFLQRIRFGTFDKRDMPNHAFIAILTENQIQSKGSIGHKWLLILKEAGFEFIRSVSNSVYTGQALSEYTEDRGSSRNYIFMLVRNIGVNGDGDPFTAPKAWSDLGTGPEAWSEISPARRLELGKEQHTLHTAYWNNVGPAKLLSEKQVEAAGAPVVLAGNRVEWAKQQTKEAREKAKANSGQFKAATDTAAAVQNAFPAATTGGPVA